MKLKSHPLITARADDIVNSAELLVKYGGNSSAELQHIVQSLHNALSFDTASSRIHSLLAEAYIRVLDYSSTISCLRFVMQVDPNHQRCRHMLFEILVLSGLEIFRHGRYYAKACYRFSEALKLESSRPKIWTFKAICHIQMGEFKEALESTTRAIHTSSPPSADLFVMRAKLLWAEGLIDQGTRDIHAARSLDKNHSEVIAFTQRSFRESEKLYKSACQHFQEKNFAACTRDIRIALMMTSEDVKLYMLLSKTQRMEGNLEEAYTTLQKVKHMYEVKSTALGNDLIIPVEVSRQINLIFNEMAIDLANKGQYDKAIVLFKKLIDSERKIHKNEANMDHRFFVNLGDCYRALENGDKALSSYRAALRINPSDFDVKVRISMTHYLLGTKMFNDCRFEAAEKEMSMAIHFNGRVSEYFAVRGKSRFYLGDYTGAHSDYLRAIELNPRSTDILDRLRQFENSNHLLSDSSTQFELGLSSNLTNLHSSIPLPTNSIVPSTEDQIEMMLNAKNLRASKHIKTHLQAKYKKYPVSFGITDINHSVESERTSTRALLPKLNPSLIPVIEAAALVQNSKRAVKDIFKNTEGLTLKKDISWTMMACARESAVVAMKPKHLKNKNNAESLPASAAAMKRLSHQKSKNASKNGLVLGVVTSKDDEFIKAISQPALNIRKGKSLKSFQKVQVKVDESGV